jgi:hypothetical protein
VLTNCNTSLSANWAFKSARTLAVPVIGNQQSRIAASNVNIYPNPAQDMLNIDFGTEQVNAMIHLYSIDGKLLRSIKANSSSTLQLSTTDLTAGVYFVRIQNGTESSNHKFVKK